MEIRTRHSRKTSFHLEGHFWAMVPVLLLMVPASLFAGPPFTTDDPEPLEYRQGEILVASQVMQDQTGWSGTAPEFEFNYGVMNNLQLHIIAPLAFSAPNLGDRAYGLGDTELGAMFCFFRETATLPCLGTFPHLELPTGRQDLGLGTGTTRVFLPLWLKKNLGPVVTYGGGGYWINPGADQQNYWFFGWVVQCQVLTNLALGAETYHTTPEMVGGESSTRFNVGLTLDLSEAHHLLLSAGRDYQALDSFQGYFAYQLTFGPPSLPSP
jgi:hypothetical protein